jgi:hypothetical protein
MQERFTKHHEQFLCSFVWVRGSILLDDLTFESGNTTRPIGCMSKYWFSLVDLISLAPHFSEVV